MIESTLDCSHLISPVEDDFINGIWADDDEDEYLTKHHLVQDSEDIANASEDQDIDYLTRSGRPYQDVPQSGPSTNTNVTTPSDGENISPDHLLKQLQKTKADLSVWQLVASSYPHRQALLQALAKLNVAHNSTPDEVVNLVFQDSHKLSNPVTFSDEDLPPFGASHDLALYITITCLRKNVPMTLVDDGSAVNVIPLKTARKLGMKESDWTSTNQGVRAYDGTRRQVVGLVNLVIATGPIERKVDFLIVDVEASFNILLGRPWIHASKAVTSTLHQKVKIPLNGKVVTIPSSPIKAIIEKVSSNQVATDPVCELGGFQSINLVESELAPLYFNPYSNLVVNHILKSMGYFPGMPINPLKESTFAPYKEGNSQKIPLGLGYMPTKEEALEMLTQVYNRRKDEEIQMRHYLPYSKWILRQRRMSRTLSRVS